VHHMNVSSSMQFDKSSSNLLMSGRNSAESKSYLLPDMENSPANPLVKNFEGGSKEDTR